MADAKADAEALVPKFQLDRILNQDQAGRRTALYGTVDAQPAVLLLERAPFPAEAGYLGALPASLARLRNLGANDIYRWYVARSDPAAAEGGAADFAADLKINLIYPCTEAHVSKYSRQGVRVVTETAEVYAARIRPFMERKRAQGRLNWVFNIIEGRQEADDVIYRTPLGAAGGEEGFLLLPDLNWDRRTLDALHLLALVERRDLWSLRDLRRRHIPWLRHMRARLVAAIVESYPSVDADQLKLYVHYQPTYYHFHIHIVHAALEAGPTQATGKAFGLDAIIETLEVMRGGEDAGMDALSMSYTLGEASELWTDVFEPLKSGRASQ